MRPAPRTHTQSPTQHVAGSHDVIRVHGAVMAHADWIIDLGPGAGHAGGRIVFEGTPADLVAARSTLTGEHLAAYVGI
jgi:excinuclease UvrABC ATPase subunit